MEPFRIRRATVADADVIAWHRASMFHDMGDIPPELFEPFRATSRDKIHRMLESGEYIGWLASPANEDKIIAGAGVQLREVMPHPTTNSDGEISVAEGRHAIVINVYTEPEWRRRGLGALLMKYIIDWSREQKLDRLVLHAAEDARPLYERLGFVSTNEMRFIDDKKL
jgi:GNAT superfamily N-acetyltransferase